ncbi:MAG TPA: ABC transporter permease, partial [Dongiaceae bacterium]|nr:ABC transporter permease [Dongiaceae bacterium]
MSEALSAGASPAVSTSIWGWLRRVLASIGRETRRRTRFMLLLGSLTWGVVRSVPRPSSWRRTVRAEFRRALRQAISGGLSTVLVTAALIGVLMVYQALYWLGAAGQEGLIGPILVTILVREIAPVLVGLI